MKLIKQTIAVFLLPCLFPNLQAKPLELTLDQTEIEAVIQNHEMPSSRIEMTVQNAGENPILQCMPYFNEMPCLSLESLALQLAGEEHPLLVLADLWSRSVIQDDSIEPFQGHPLDLLNFKGTCTKKDFSDQFTRLCMALGFETRRASVHGKNVYDFCLENEWNFLDITAKQHYLGLDNIRLASSEEVMDDPFLALRAKHLRTAQHVDIKESWKEVALFEILEPRSAEPEKAEIEEIISRPEKFDLYPQEALRYCETRRNTGQVEHMIQVEQRGNSCHLQYDSPFPIQRLENRSSTPLRIEMHNIELSPGESIAFEDERVFHLFLVFADKPKGQLVATSTCAKGAQPSLLKGLNRFNIGALENSSTVRVLCEMDDNLVTNATPSLRVLNPQSLFDNASPAFSIQAKSEIDKVWWQISSDPSFTLIPSNFDQIEPYSSVVSLPLISETFLNPDQEYYFRVKGSSDGQWGDWSENFIFSVKKPLAVQEVETDRIDQLNFELKWDRYAEESDEPIEYLIFGSNSLDFVPSLYTDSQVNAIVDGKVVEEDIIDNLITVTNEPRAVVSGSLAYYRIIAKSQGQFSVPSHLIHLYDHDLIQPRNVLQIEENQRERIAKRKLFPRSYPWNQSFLPCCTQQPFGKNLIAVQALLRSASALENSKYAYESPEVKESIWEEVRPYLLPENHPAWPKLNRIFCESRSTLSPQEFRKAGFKRWRPGRWSRVSASSHPELKEYFIKAYCDVETGILYDWKKWIHRIRGAEAIHKCIKDYHLQDHFTVPQKWIYPLPKTPSPPSSSLYVRKNFILVCENMRIQDHPTNQKMYKKKMSHEKMRALYIVLQVCGLYDSVYCFNIPFCKDGKISVIDTEYHHKWPVPFHKLKKSFSKEMRSYWEKITFNGGKIPNGATEPNPPRMDRRDKP